MPKPEITPVRDIRQYDAEEYAARLCPAKPLDGTVKSAQDYSDRITRSVWWEKNCPASWRGNEEQDCLFYVCPHPPRRILVFEGRKGGGAAFTDNLRQAPRGRWYPYTILGHGTIHNGLQAIMDPWVILHELAHHMSAPLEPKRHHDGAFIGSHLQLVRRYLGLDSYTCLKEGIRKVGLRLPGDLSS